MKTKNAPAAPIVQSTARGIERCGSEDSSPSEAAASKPTNRRIPRRTPPSTPPPVMPSHEVSLGLNIENVTPSSPPLPTITSAEDQHRDEREERERQHRPDGDADAAVVQRENDRQREERPDPPGRAGVGDVRGPEAVDQDAEPEVDPAAAEEQHPDEEEPGRQDAEPRVRAVREVLVHGSGAGEAARVERDDVADREHSERRDQDGEGRVPSRADVGARDPPRISATENIGPIASDCATAWIVERFFSPRLALGAVESV